MPPYRLRPATLDDLDLLVHHRAAMFTGMGVPAADGERAAPPFRAWVAETMPAEIYRAWLVEQDDGAVVAGGGMTVLPWPSRVSG